MATYQQPLSSPPIPERTSVRTSLSIPKDKKRRSLPASPRLDSRRRSSNHVVIKPASPEVISTLIDTLSAISTPTSSNPDDPLASQSTPVSPSAWSTHFPPSSTSTRAPPSPLINGFSIDENLPEDAPLKHRGSLLNPGQGKDLAGRLSQNEKSSQTRALDQAYESLLDDAYSIGTPSVEQVIPEEPSATRKAPTLMRSVRSLRSSRSIRSLGLQKSNDSLQVIPKQKDSEPRRERLFLSDSRSPSPEPSFAKNKQGSSLDPFDLLHSPDEMEVKPSVFVTDHSSQTSEAPSQSIPIPSQSKRNSYAFPREGQIPRRDSSKRHSLTFAAKKMAQGDQSVQHEENRESEADAQEESFHTPPQTPGTSLADLGELEVVRRIEELKAQKAQRDQIFAEDNVHGASTEPGDAGQFSDLTTLEKGQTDLSQGDGVKDISIQPASEQLGEKLDGPEPAPSPTIPPVHHKKDANATFRPFPTTSPFTHSARPSRDDARSFSAPNSAKLQKRRSLHGNPTEKPRRRLSNPLGLYSAPSNAFEPAESILKSDDPVDQYLQAPRFSQTIHHPESGRAICFSEVGHPEGSVVFCCVGMGLTRYITAFYDELATTLRLRLITPDRPGVGRSEPHTDGSGTPLSWPDDVRAICEARRITKFSVLAHSAGAIYALATALRMSQHMRCRVHLLAPWIPPSQMSSIGSNHEPLPSAAIPYSQRFLRSLPTTFFRAANSNLFSVTSTSITTSLPRTPKRAKQSRNKNNESPALDNQMGDAGDNYAAFKSTGAEGDLSSPDKDGEILSDADSAINMKETKVALKHDLSDSMTIEKGTYEGRLASAIWDLATANANPSVDLIVCLERRQPIGFRYADITRGVVIHHGSKDNRVPVDNVKWLGKTMRRCEVRVLEGEGHGLMGSAQIMGDVLMEMASEWDDWNRVVKGES